MLASPWSARRKPLAEINVVPYIDVMLVLLVIFMVTAPLLTQGVVVDLPQASAEALPQQSLPPLVVTVDARGGLYLEQEATPVSAEALAVRVTALLRVQPQRPVLVRGDKAARYEQVLQAMALLKRVGVAKVGLMTQEGSGAT